MDSIENLKHECESCMRCSLGRTRTNLVFGDGNPEADILFVGEGPGEQEDLKGLPFVGPAGQLLDVMLQLIGLLQHRQMSSAEEQRSFAGGTQFLRRVAAETDHFGGSKNHRLSWKDFRYFSYFSGFQNHQGARTMV